MPHVALGESDAASLKDVWEPLLLFLSSALSLLKIEASTDFVFLDRLLRGGDIDGCSSWKGCQQSIW